MVESGASYLFNARARGDWVRLRTLVVLRWIAVTGQAAAVLLASLLMGFQLEMTLCALLISASVVVNLASYLTFPSETRLNERWTLASLFFDLAQLVSLLMVTGGLNNPFAVLILAPITISATALRLQSTVWLGISAMLAVVVMGQVYLPLIQADGTELEVPELYRGGMTAALAIAVVFLSLYARRVTVEGYAMSEALQAAQVALGREQRLSEIGGIAAATAHELGTPLATIKLVAGELAREVRDPTLSEDIALIRREAERCGAILADLGRGARDDRQVKHAPISSVIEEAAKPHMGRGPRLILRIDGAPADEAEDGQPVITRTPELIHGLRNLIQNAVDFARTTVWIDVETERAGEIRLVVGDDGPGFSADILPRLGEPYVSSRRRGRRRQDAGAYEGLGLGLFIARTLLQRTGAAIAFANGSDERRRRRQSDSRVPPEAARPPGALVELVWPREQLETPRAVARGALGPNERIES